MKERLIASNRRQQAIPNKTNDLISWLSNDDKQGNRPIPANRMDVLKKRLLLSVFQSTFLKKLGAEAKKHTELGHKNEKLIVQALMRDTANDTVDTIYNTECVAVPGLVRKRGSRCDNTVKDSTDFIGASKDDLPRAITD